MAFPVEFYYFVGSALTMIFLVLMLVNFMFGGLFLSFLNVKISRGARVLVKIRTSTRDYFRPGTVSEGYLLFKDSKKAVHRIKIRPSVFYRAATILWCDVDEEKNNFFDRYGVEQAGHDAVAFEHLLTRALYRPSLVMDNYLKLLIVLLCVVLLGLIVVGFMVFKTNQNVSNVGTLLVNVSSLLSQGVS